MKIEILNKTNKNKVIIGVFLCVLILLVLVISTSRAKYKLTESINIAKGTINYSLSDLEIVEIYLDGVETDTVPTSGYTFNSEDSYCTVSGEKDDSVELSYEDGKMYVSYTNKNTKCYLYFNEITSVEKTTTVTCSASSASCSTTKTISDLESVVSVTSDKGSVTHTLSGTKLTLKFSGGSYTSREWVSDIVEYECCDTCRDCESYETEEYDCSYTGCPDGYTSYGSYGCCAGSTSNCVGWITIEKTCEKEVCAEYSDYYECNCSTCTRDDGYYKYTYTWEVHRSG